MLLSKEMNWNYVKENYEDIFKETFGRESMAIKAVKLSYGEAMELEIEELVEYIKIIEQEMSYMSDNCSTNVETAKLLSSWCVNMIQNIDYAIQLKQNR